jgi:hypothetical protein
MKNYVCKPIENYENYLITNCGKVYSVKRKKFLKPYSIGKGYLLVKLSKNGKVKIFLIHRLVAMAFLENSENLPQVNHKNEIKTDNRLENLEYCDCQYNVDYSLSKAVLQIDKRTGKVIQEFKSIMQAERETGINNSSICACCKGKLKTAGGFIWRYKKTN